MSDRSDDATDARQRAIESLLRGGERVAKGRQRRDREGDGEE